ncbi:hypothetical protein [Mycoplasmopsis adleri]|uniref:hypothetical protein n=1 Tax=Mycoplasmopsis adleri TaxID=51362 RepID=UPI0038732123
MNQNTTLIDKKQGIMFIDDLSELDPKAKIVDNTQKIDFEGKLKKKLKWNQKIFDIQNPWLKIFLKTLLILLEFFVIAFIVITITFFLINSVPGGTGITAGLDEASRKAVEEKYGLNEPLIIRYFIYLYSFQK